MLYCDSMKMNRASLSIMAISSELGCLNKYKQSNNKNFLKGQPGPIQLADNCPDLYPSALVATRDAEYKPFWP